jgi:hypothetical protein
MNRTNFRTICDRADDLRNMGTMNPDIFKLPVFQSGRKNGRLQARCRELGKLAEALRAENQMMREKLNELLSEPHLVGPQLMEKRQLELVAKISRHGSKLKEFTSRMQDSRTSSSPSLVGASAVSEKDGEFDPILWSLLVANTNWKSLPATALENWNSELESWIRNQKEKLWQLGGRLNLYEGPKNQKKLLHSNSDHLDTKFPSQIDELRMTHRVLRSELSSLVKMRKELTEPLRKQKMKGRQKIKLAWRKAIDIQRVFRGWRSRELVKKARSAVTSLSHESPSELSIQEE